MPKPPALTADQRQAALEKAAEARRVRADLKERLKMGSVSLGDLFDKADSDDIVGKLKVLALLESLPGDRQGEGPPGDGGDRHQREPSGAGPRRATAQGAPGGVPAQ